MESSSGGVVKTVVALVVICACAGLFVFDQPAPSKASGPQPRPRLHPVALANRTVQPSEFGGPTAPVSLSPRGTAAYALACAVPVTREIREAAASFGARVVGYLPRQALLVEASPSAITAALGDSRFVGASAYLPSDKVRAGVTDGEVTVTPLAECDRDSLAEFIWRGGGSVCVSGPSIRGSFGATVTKEMLVALADRGDVLWIDRRTRPTVLNDYAVCDTGVTNAWNSLGLTGRGQVIATADTGIDTGDAATIHHDFTNRVVAISDLGGYTTADYNGHGTHTAGTIGGSGAMSDGRYRGVAYEAGLYVQTCGTDVVGANELYLDLAETFDDIFAAGIPYGAYIHSDSWGGEHDGVYEEFCEGVDDVSWNNPELLVVVAAGNGGSGASTISSPGGAKNVLTVGNSFSSRNGSNPKTIVSGSSRGPCKDGRIKPDIIAPGATIVSCRTSMRPGLPKFDSNGSYTAMGGTSMATPHVAGCAALVRQWLMERPDFANKLPTGALIKAVLTGGAAEMWSNYPRTTQGFGRVDIAETLAPSNRCVKLHDRIRFANGSRVAYSFTLTNAAPFEAQLVWTDYPASPSAAAAIVNDLDLVVLNKTTGEMWYGNDIDGGDRTNTVEAVRIASAEPGEYKVMVIGDTVVYDSTEGGAAALYVRGAFSADDGEEGPEWNVAVSAAGHGSLDTEGISPSAGASIAVNDFEDAVCKAPRCITVTNEYGTAVARHSLEGWTVAGVDSWIAADDGTNVVISLVVTNDVSVTWNYRAEADSYALYYILSAQDAYIDPETSGMCYIYAYDGSLYNDVLVDMTWVERGREVSVELPGDVLLDEFRFTTLYTKSAYPGGVRALDVEQSPFVLKLGAVALAETDETAGYSVDAFGVMPTALEFAMDGAKDVIGCYWDASRTVSGSSLPYWWYMRNLFCASGGGYEALSEDAAEYTTDEGDPDGDGFGNMSEYSEGTVPVDSLSFPFRVLSFSPTNIVWIGGKTATYTIESSSSPERSGEWVECGEAIPASGSVTNSAAIVPCSSDAIRFFRIKAR